MYNFPMSGFESLNGEWYISHVNFHLWVFSKFPCDSYHDNVSLSQAALNGRRGTHYIIQNQLNCMTARFWSINRRTIQYFLELIVYSEKSFKHLSFCSIRVIYGKFLTSHGNVNYFQYLLIQTYTCEIVFSKPSLLCGTDGNSP